MRRRACSWRRCRSSRATGRPTTTGGRCEARLNALPQFTTEIDGLEIHFIHVKSQHENALPLIITHGWPGSVIEMLEVDRPAHRPDGARRDGRGRVRPRAAVPARLRVLRAARRGRLGLRVVSREAWAELMRRLGYTRYVAQGGDQGAGVTDAMGRQAPDGLLGVHFNFLYAAPRELLMASINLRLAFSGEDREQLSKVIGDLHARLHRRDGRAPADDRLPVAGLTDSAWRRGCSTTTPTATRRSPAPSSTGSPTGGLTRDHILDNITLYWLTGTATSAARLYWEGGRSGMVAFKHPPPHVKLPVGYTVFPGRALPAAAPLGEAALTTTSSTSTRPTRAATSPPGKSRNCFQKSCARRSGHCARPDRSRRPTRSPGLDRVRAPRGRLALGASRRG